MLNVRMKMNTKDNPQRAFFSAHIANRTVWFSPICWVNYAVICCGLRQVSSAPTEAKIPLVEYSELTIQQRYIAQRRVVGRVEASSQGRLGFELGGTLEATLVDEGQQVEQGQLLATLDTARLDAQKAQLKAAQKEQNLISDWLGLLRNE